MPSCLTWRAWLQLHSLVMAKAARGSRGFENDHRWACYVQLQQESLQHATALQGLAQLADAAATQMHDLQRLMEAMQSALQSLGRGQHGSG